MINNILDKKFLLFLAIGLMNTAIGLGTTLSCLHFFGIDYFMANLIGYTLGLINSYFMNRRFTFKNKEKISQTLWKFLVVFVFSYFSGVFGGKLSAFFLEFVFSQKIFDFFSFDTIASILGIGFYTLVNYLGNLFFTFRKIEK